MGPESAKSYPGTALVHRPDGKQPAERAKQEAGFGAFEVRTYTGLIRHWLCSRMAMFFLAEQTERLRGEKSADHSGAGGGGSQRSGLGDLDLQLAWTA